MYEPRELAEVALKVLGLYDGEKDVEVLANHIKNRFADPETNYDDLSRVKKSNVVVLAYPFLVSSQEYRETEQILSVDNIELLRISKRELIIKKNGVMLYSENFHSEPIEKRFNERMKELGFKL